MNRLKALRLEKDLLQSDIAKIIDKGERTVGFYETGDRDMGTQTLSKLSDFFGVSIDYLLGKSDIKNTIELDETEIAFASGIKCLNTENQKILKSIMESLLAKQDIDNQKIKDE